MPRNNISPQNTNYTYKQLSGKYPEKEGKLRELPVVATRETNSISWPAEIYLERGISGYSFLLIVDGVLLIVGEKIQI
uniref:Uncharacterized protein n=1 Tax=uncultured Desulfobacterium sp. TaxID=201089 RepID=E1YFH2_9BACT|nr:unknown protein [uncultured Desulfobacterium sp.]